MTVASPISIIDLVVRFYEFLIIGYVLLSWFPGSGSLGELRRVIGTLTEPYLGFFRRMVPMLGVGGAGIDFSPIVALFALQILYRIVVRPLLLYIL